MSRTLVVAEKPSVARDIARVLGCTRRGEGCLEGDAYVVTWALGHLVQQADPDAYGEQYRRWTLEDLPIQPDQWKLEVAPRTAAQYQIIRKWMHAPDIDRLLCATDSGREGELIFRWIYEAANCKKPFDRLWISSMTDAAIQEGFNNIQPGSAFDGLFASARSRARADWLVGMNATRAYTIRYKRVLSVGRVQTPTLALMVQRQREIDAFVPQAYWEVWAEFETTATYKGAWIGNLPPAEALSPPAQASQIQDAADENDDTSPEEKNAAKPTRLPTKEAATALVARLKGKPAHVADVQIQEKHQPPPLLYDLTELQREANRKFGFSAQKTLDIAQVLYERAKYITYPRTDSRYLSHDMEPKLPEILKALAQASTKTYDALIAPLRGKPLHVTSRIINDERVTDHHAIIPTPQRPRVETLSEDERAIYDLVARRFIAVLYPDYRYEVTRMITVIEAAPDEPFLTRGRRVLEPGWTVVQAETTADELLPTCQPGDLAKVLKLRSAANKTKPPSPYTEATLLSGMENAGRRIDDETLRENMKDSGLGTPATRAAIIQRLLAVGYIQRKGKALQPTEKGMKLMEVLPGEIQSAETTGKWEKALTSMTKGEMSEERFMGSIRRFVDYLLQDAKGPIKPVEFPPEDPKKRSTAHVRQGAGTGSRPEAKSRPGVKSSTGAKKPAASKQQISGTPRKTAKKPNNQVSKTVRAGASKATRSAPK